MNKVILMGRLTRDPELRYSSGAEPIAVAKYTLAVNRRFKRDGEPDVDFINCTAFGKQGEFAERYFKKGQMVAISGRLQISSYDDQNGNKRWSTDIIIDDQYFAESKASFESREHGGGGNNPAPPSNYGTTTQPQSNATENQNTPNGFFSIEGDIDEEDLPF